MKQALTEALAEYGETYAIRWFTEILPIIAAARLVERLLPERCTCVAGYADIIADVRCSICHGYARVWDEGIVEAVAEAIFDSGLVEADTAWDNLESDEEWIREEYRRHARAALSALVELLTEKVET